MLGGAAREKALFVMSPLPDPPAGPCATPHTVNAGYALLTSPTRLTAGSSLGASETSGNLTLGGHHTLKERHDIV